MTKCTVFYISNFKDAKVQDVISKHLIKTVGTEIVSEMLKLIADEQMIQVNDEHLNTDVLKKA
jgi:hypothetical protein